MFVMFFKLNFKKSIKKKKTKKTHEKYFKERKKEKSKLTLGGSLISVSGSDATGKNVCGQRVH